MILTNEKLIAAPRETVWRTTIDIQNWPEWTPTVAEAVLLENRPFGLGSTARIRQPGMPETVWKVTAYDEGNGFTWQTRVFGIDIIATHTLEPMEQGTKSILRFESSGWITMLLWPVLWMSANRALEQENKGLKAACESASQTSA